MTQIDATILSKEDFDAKAKEVEKLVASVELYSSTEEAEKMKEEVQLEFDNLARNLYALDCAYLDAKVQSFTKVVEMLKK